MAIEVRPARADEAALVGQVVVAGYDADGHLIRDDGSRDEEYAGWLGRVGERIGTDTVVVAVDEHDEVVGAVTWCPYGSPSAEVARTPDEGEFRTLAVAPSGRGRGAGRALVQWCLDEARRRGMTAVWLCSLPQMAPAHRLYESMGFARAPERDWRPHPDLVLWAFRHRLTSRETPGPAA